jgi:hypothetical protein
LILPQHLFGGVEENHDDMCQNIQSLYCVWNWGVPMFKWGMLIIMQVQQDLFHLISARWSYLHIIRKSPRKLVQGIMLLTYIQEVTDLNLTWGTDYPDLRFLWSLSVLPDKCQDNALSKAWLFSSTHFALHYSESYSHSMLYILQLLIALLNKLIINK